MENKRNLGKVTALYPTPVTVVGVMAGAKPNWLLMSHVGHVSHSEMVISCSKAHYSHKFIRDSKRLSINIVDEGMLLEADYVGRVSAAEADKSEVFEYELCAAGTPVIKAAPVTMECSVIDIYETAFFDNFILRIENTYAQERVLDKAGKLDYTILKPVVFEMPTYQYLATGKVLGKCRHIVK